MILGARALLTVAQFVCPLLFFTDLTRNPYYTQITLLNIALMFAAALWLSAHAFGAEGEPRLRLPRTPLDAPLAAWLGVCAASWLLAYLGHAPFFRPSMRSEGLRVFLFTLVNTVVPYYLAAAAAADCPAEPSVRPGRWALFAVVWGAAWLLFSGLRGPASGSTDAWPHLWDGYGAFLWAAGLAVSFRLSRRGGVHEWWHLALAAAFVSSVYGVFQYCNVEWVWPKVLNPYGGRSVSTFGNPNFMSSYLVMLLPVCAAYYLQARGNASRLMYGVVLLAMEAALLCSLTRSSWLGAAAGLAVFALHPAARERSREGLQAHGLLVTAAVLMVVFWPQSAVSGYTPSVLGRVRELGDALNTQTTMPYSPLYQRVLIWSCAWLMGRENFLLGKGWGLFELFYPYFQGHMLSHFDFFRYMRTHANNAHNEVLELFAQTGIAGVGAMAWLWVVFFACAWRWFRKDRQEPQPLWGWAAAAGVAGMLVDNLLNVSMHFAVPAFVLWWQAGTAMGRPAPPGGRNREARLPAGAAKAAAVGALLLAAAGSHHWWRQWNREVEYFMGFKLMRGSRLGAAVEHLEAAHRWHSREVNADYELGNAYARSNRFDKALWAYGEALRSNAGYDEIFFNEGTVLVQRFGRVAEGLEAYRTASWINPISYELYAAYTATLLREPEKNREEAIEVLERAVHFYPEDPGFLNNLGTLYNRRGDRKRAVEAWARALELNPDLAEAAQNLATLPGEGKASAALARLRAFKELEGRVAAKDFSPATLERARRAVEAFPRSQKARYYLGNLELIHGRPDRALELLEPLSRADPAHEGLNLNLGQVYARLGRRAEAAAAFRRVLEANPNNAQARQLLSAVQ